MWILPPRGPVPSSCRRPPHTELRAIPSSARRPPSWKTRPVRHLFDRIVELPAPVMSSLLERVPRPVHPASTFAFLADGPPEGMVAGPPSAEQIPVDEDTLGDLTEALQLACRSRTALILLDRSPAGRT